MTARNKQDMKSTIKEAIKELLNDDEFIARIAEKVIEKVDKKLQELETRTAALEQENCDLKNKVVEIEQYSRNNIRIFSEEKGKKEKENLAGKMTKFFKYNLNVQLEISDIETCHHVGEVKDGKKTFKKKSTL